MTRVKEVPYLKGDNSKIQNKLGWNPICKWQDVADEMLLAD